MRRFLHADEGGGGGWGCLTIAEELEEAGWEAVLFTGPVLCGLPQQHHSAPWAPPVP